MHLPPLAAACSILLLLLVLAPAMAANAPTPRLARPWIRLAAPPVLERHAKPGAQAVDFTIFQAGDGTWQLVSCIRGTAVPGGGRLLYRWESARLTDADWTPKGIFREADPALGHREGSLQAPHCVRDGDRWWMFCNSNGARCLTSGDGRTFAWATGDGGSGKFFDMARDVMLLDHRPVDGRWYAFFTDIQPGRYPQRKDHTVCVRTAERLDGVWSQKADVGVLTAPEAIDPRYAFAEAESPFVLARKGWYYRWEQMDVHLSATLAPWTAAGRVELVPGDRHAYLSPEVVECDGTTYLAAYSYSDGRSGIYLAALAWSDQP
jgi:hypothetical protein